MPVLIGSPQQFNQFFHDWRGLGVIANTTTKDQREVSLNQRIDSGGNGFRRRGNWCGWLIALLRYFRQ